MSAGPILLIMVVVLLPLGVILWNKQKVKGKILGAIVRKDKSVKFQLLELRDDFIIWGNRAYELYPSLVRVAHYPIGLPRFLQEIVPAVLLDEEDRLPLDWVNLGDREGSAMELKAALEENWVRKLVQEAAAEPGEGFKLNMKKLLPIGLVVLGAIGLIVMLYMRSR
jgi:preprotein translocase subunit Sss1